MTDPLVSALARTIWRAHQHTHMSDYTTPPPWAIEAAEKIAQAITDTVVSWPEATIKGIVEALEGP